jgi:hypothetical protein
MRRGKFLVWFVLTSTVIALGQAQKLGFSDAAAPPFIVRMQRTGPGKDVCAIVRGDGLFHVEQETSNDLEVAEGVLSEEELAALKTVLSEKGLVALTQQAITVPLMIRESDKLQISILRPPLTQNLIFLDRESRRPFDPFLKPLLHWMDILQSHSHGALDERRGSNQLFTTPQETI